MKRRFSGILLMLFSVSMLIVVFNIQPVRSEPRTWIVDDYGPADFHVIQEAINTANFGDIISVKTGTYHENIVVNQTVLLVGEDRENTIIDADGDGTAIYVTSNNTIITGFTVERGEETGIHLESNINITIRDNNIRYNKYSGIHLEYSCSNLVEYNDVIDNGFGILLDACAHDNMINENCIIDNSMGIRAQCGAYDNTLTNNRIEHNSQGIKYVFSTDNTWRNNTFSCNGYNLYICGTSLGHFIQDIDMSNIIDGKPIYYWVNRKDDVISSEAGFIGLVNCMNITVTDSKTGKNYQGILIAYTNKSMITDNQITRSRIAAQIYHSHHNIITKNNISCDNGMGFLISFSSKNSIQRNRITTNCGNAIHLRFCSDNIIAGNDITTTLHASGIYLEHSSHNRIAGNDLTNNRFGVYLHYSSNHTILENYIADNIHGIYSYKSSDNRIYHNSFMSNMKHYDSEDSLNFCDDDYPSGGNYWSDYTRVDLYRGPHQNISGSDGIGDTPYIIDANITDNYPLMRPWMRYTLAIYGSPIEVMIAIDGTFHTTPWSGIYDKGTLVDLVMPRVYDEYVWSHWLEDGDINRTKTVVIDTYTSYTGVFFHFADVNQDEFIDMRDIAVAARAFGSYPKHLRWNSLADINEDDNVDMRDIALVARHFGGTNP